MRKLLEINDLHIGVERVAGTTPQSAQRLRKDLIEAVEDLIMGHLDCDLYINGDALDSNDIAMSDLLGFYNLCSRWLVKAAIVTGRVPMLFLARGNHDISKDSSRLSSFDFIGAILESEFRDQVMVITEPQMLSEEHHPCHYVIPHLANQELFNLALEAVPAAVTAPCYIHVHANYDNGFTAESDHSLNVSAEQAKKLTDAGYHLVFGHEHQQKNLHLITIVGNQFPTSVADCLNNDTKRAVIYDSGLDREDIETWRAAGSFVEVDWTELASVPADADFIRVTGKASTEDAAKVLQTVSKFRQTSGAYVVTNAVKFEGQGDMPELEVSAAEMKAVDVLEYLYEQLEPSQIEVVKKLLAGRETNVSV